MLNETKKQNDSLKSLLTEEKKINEQYQSENSIIKNREIELKEKNNINNREINQQHHKLENLSIKNKNLVEDLNSSNKKLNNLNYELDLLKSDLEQ